MLKQAGMESLMYWTNSNEDLSQDMKNEYLFIRRKHGIGV